MVEFLGGGVVSNVSIYQNSTGGNQLHVLNGVSKQKTGFDRPRLFYIGLYSVAAKGSYLIGRGRPPKFH